MGKYFREIDLSEKNSAHTKIINLVGSNKRILEFGCASGYMSKVLKEKFNCELVGLEINREDAKEAETYCKEVIVGDIENLEWCEKLSGSRFDVAIFADVLEHLKDPKAVLIEVKNVLSEDGYILVSVPNIANTSIRLELLLGSFEYEELGILDNTHLKYFTLKSLINLIEDAGFYIELVDYVVKDIPVKIIEETLKLIDLKSSKKTLNYFSGIESIAYEFVVRALNLKPKGYTNYIFKEIKKPERVFEKVFQEQAKQIEGKYSLIKEQAQQIEAKDSLIQGHIQQIEAKDTHISNLETTIKDKDAHVGNLEEELRQSVQVIEEQAQQIEAKDSLIQGHIQQIEAKDTHISNLETTIKDKDAHVGNLEEELRQSVQVIEERVRQIQAKDAHIGNLGEQIGQLEREVKDKDGMIQEQTQELQAKDSVIQEQAKQIQGKDAHIHNIESELNLIKGSKVWCAAEFFRRLFYFNLLRRFPLLQKGMLTISSEGFRQFFAKMKNYLSRNKNVVTSGLIESDYDKWIRENRLTDDMIEEIKKEISQFDYSPKISIIMPVYNVDQIWLKKAIDSVISQLYKNWELCIADDASTKKHTKKTLERYSKKDKRIKIKYLAENQGISGASNEALSLATGEFVGLLDNDDELTIDALYENVKLLNRNHKADLIYSDEDKINTNGNRVEPFFKPDYSPDFLLTNNYICHFSLFRKSLVNNIGGFRKGYEGSQDYDLILRFIEKTKPEKILHVPKILYHWRKILGSAAAIADAKSYAFVAAKKALSYYLRRNGIQGEIIDGNFVGSYRVRREIKNDYKVSIIIPFKDQSEVLRRCIKSIVGRTKYREYEIVLVNNQSEKEETFEYLAKIKDNPIFRILDYDKPFNFSAINNYAVSQIDSEYLVLLNNDTEIISSDWIEAMLEFAQRKDVGAVGALLYYPNDTVQHGGIILGIKGVAAHSHLGSSKDSMGYFGRLKTIQNLSAVTAACLMCKKSVYNEVGGFDENYSHAFNDVDFCLKIREKGYLIVYTPYAELYHHESLSRGYEDTPEKQERFKKEIEYFQRKWNEVLTKGDPYYNPNLTLAREDFSIRI